MKLIRDQTDLESKYGLRVAGLPLFHTVLEVGIDIKLRAHLKWFHLLTRFDRVLLNFLQCVKGRHHKIAEQLRKDFKLSDSQ